MNKEEELRFALSRAADRMRSLNVGTSGNVSARLEDDFIISPSGVSVFKPNDAIKVNIRTRLSVERGHRGKPSSEKDLHALIYEVRSDIASVVHFHSSTALALAAVEPWPAGQDVLSPYAVPLFHYDLWHLGIEGKHRGIPFVPYAHPGSIVLAEQVANAFKQNRAKVAVMERHGAVTLGATVSEAVQNAIFFQHLAKSYLRAVSLARESGRTLRLFSPEEFDDFRREVERMGYGRKD